jgi:hypothetical protein
MEMNRLTREADELIRKVVARYNTLYTPTGTISQVELDLLLDDLKQMYEKFKMLGQLNLQHQFQDHKKTLAPSPATATPVADDQVIPITNTQQEMVEDEKPASPPSEPEVKDEAMIINKEEEVIPTAPVESISKGPEPPPSTRHIESTDETPITLADKYKSNQKSIRDVISHGNSGQDNLGSRLAQTSFSDLRSVIGLAEKFALVNELFGGDLIAYEKAIVQLNGATRLAEAEAYLGTLRLNHKWPADSPQSNLLTEIVQRKFNL